MWHGGDGSDRPVSPIRAHISTERGDTLDEAWVQICRQARLILPPYTPSLPHPEGLCLSADTFSGAPPPTPRPPV